MGLFFAIDRLIGVEFGILTKLYIKIEAEKRF